MIVNMDKNEFLMVVLVKYIILKKIKIRVQSPLNSINDNKTVNYKAGFVLIHITVNSLK